MLIVLDTNVLVSGLLNEVGIPRQVVDMAIKREIRLAVDKRIVQEYVEVTARSHLRIPRILRDDALSVIIGVSFWVKAQPLNLPASKVFDPKDLPFAEVAVAAKADALVTGNKRHFTFLAAFGIEVLTPAEFVQRESKVERE